MRLLAVGAAVPYAAAHRAATQLLTPLPTLRALPQCRDVAQRVVVDHTREQVPVLVAGAGHGSLGQLQFSDVAVSIAKHLGVNYTGHGRSFL